MVSSPFLPRPFFPSSRLVVGSSLPWTQPITTAMAIGATPCGSDARPGSRNVLSVSVPAASDMAGDPVLLTAVVLSFIPWAIAVGAFCLLVRYPRVRVVRAAALCVAASTALTEFGLKPLMQQPRPPTSCVAGYGFPSSHSAIAVGTATAWAETALRRARSPTHTALAVGACGLLAVGVPWSRVHLGDHTLSQVLAGVSIGLANGSLFAQWLRRRRFVRR